MLRELAQCFARQLSRFVAREPRHEEQRAGQKHGIDTSLQALSDVLFGFPRRHHKGRESGDRTFIDVRQNKDSVMDTIKLQ
jgi:hypothetical protein